MVISIFSMVSETHLDEILSNLHEFTGLFIQLTSESGAQIKAYGEMPSCCSSLIGKAFEPQACQLLRREAGIQAMKHGNSFLFTCQSGLKSISFPLVHKGELLGTVAAGPFLTEKPDSFSVCKVAEKFNLALPAALKLFEQEEQIPIFTQDQIAQLQKLLKHLLSPLLPDERALLLHEQKKVSQQVKINETIQILKEEVSDNSLAYFNQKEKELLANVRSGTIAEVKGLLNDLMGHILFSEGSNVENVRIRCIELTTLLSRIAIDGGAKTESIYMLNSKFIARLYREDTPENICIMMQEVLESFMNSMFNETDKGNVYIRKALRFMNDNYSKHLELAQVAEYAGLSPNYFSSLFHQIVGESFRDYLCKIRVEESKRLLLSTQYSLADIAVSMGFPDQSYYCKVFKKFVGVTPGKYRG